jgi:hypothetical protein
MALGGLGYLLVAAATLSCGCIGRGDLELVEANLRQQQDLSADYQRQLASLRKELLSAQSEVDDLRSRLAAAGTIAPQEHTEPLSRVVGVQFNAMMTGGRDQDGLPGHEVITAVFAPHDDDGDLVKLSGAIELELIDLARSGEEQRIGRWSFSPEEARELWHSGFLASGYQFDLPLKTAPKNGQALLHGRLTTSDGRQFDASHALNLVAAQSGSSPGNLRPASDARPLGGTRRSASAVAGKEKAALPQTDAAGSTSAVQSSGTASLEDEVSLEADAGPSKPVPNPPADVPADESGNSDLPRVRPIPSSAEADADRPRPFPSVTQTSDRWTGDTIPYLR